MINNLNLSIDKLSNFCDALPVISTVTNLIHIFLKAVCPLLPSSIQGNRFFTHIREKSLSRCLVLLIPILGNITIALYDRIQAKTLKKAGPLRELDHEDNQMRGALSNASTKKDVNAHENKSDVEINKTLETTPQLEANYGEKDRPQEPITTSIIPGILPQPEETSLLLEPRDLYDAIKSYHKIPQDIENLLDPKDSTIRDDLKKIKDYIKARDTILIWQKVANTANIDLDFKIDDDLWSSSDQMISKAQEYQQWCENHKDELSAIVKLDLSHCGLTFPPDLDIYINLKELDLSHNRLILTPNIDKCTQLKRLYLSFNKLALAPNVDNNPQLKHFYLAFNKLVLPPKVDKNSQLKTFIVCYNELTHAPKVDNNPQLKYLTLSGNNLTVPPVVDKCEKLKFLNLSDNELTCKPDIKHCPKLEWFKLDHNDLIAGVNKCTLPKTPNPSTKSFFARHTYWVPPLIGLGMWMLYRGMMIYSDFEQEPESFDYSNRLTINVGNGNRF